MPPACAHSAPLPVTVSGVSYVPLIFCCVGYYFLDCVFLQPHSVYHTWTNFQPVSTFSRRVFFSSNFPWARHVFRHSTSLGEHELSRFLLPIRGARLSAIGSSGTPPRRVVQTRNKAARGKSVASRSFAHLSEDKYLVKCVLRDNKVLRRTS